MESLSDLEGTTLGHYLLQRRLARGGMSEVYLAFDQHMQRTVAVKVATCHEDDHMQRLQHEVKVLRMLSHHHMLPIFDYGEQSSWCYFVMPYVKNGTLRERLAKGPLTQEEAGTILGQVASALQCAHEHGILHRDIKPSNILIDHENQAYLIDFGLAKEVGETNKLSAKECVIGTPEYMAPEMAEGLARPSSDTYALGILLYQMLTGRVPFKGSTPIGTCWKHVREQPLRPSLLNPAISPSIEQVILRALEKEPELRFQAAQAMAEAYQQALQTSPSPYMLELALPTTQLIKVSSRPGWSLVPHQLGSHSKPRRTVHPAGAFLVAAVLFFAIPLSVGFLMSNNHLQPQNLTAAAAGLTIAGAHSAARELPPHAKLIPPAQSAGNRSASAQESGEGYGRKHIHKHHH